jgi:hypothetical protein
LAIASLKSAPLNRSSRVCPAPAMPAPRSSTSRTAEPRIPPPANPVKVRPHPVPAVSGGVQVLLDDVQRSLAACRELLVGGGRVEADRPQCFRHQVQRSQGLDKIADWLFPGLKPRKLPRRLRVKPRREPGSRQPRP